MLPDTAVALARDRMPEPATVTLPLIVPVTVVVSKSTVVVPAPPSVPEMVPPSSVLAPATFTVPAIAPPVCLKLPLTVSGPAPWIVPPPWVRVLIVLAPVTFSTPVRLTLTPAEDDRPPASTFSVPADTLMAAEASVAVPFTFTVPPATRVVPV